MIAFKKYTILQKLQAKFLILPGKINLDEFNTHDELTEKC